MWCIVQLFCLVKFSMGRSSFYEGDIAIDVPEPEYIALDNAQGCNKQDSITSAEECKTAAASLDFNDDEIEIVRWGHAPPGCFVGYPNAWTNVYFSTTVAGTTGMSFYKSICRKGQGQGSSNQHAWITTKEKLWPGGIIPYQIDTSSIDNKQIHQNISLAIKDITDSSCLKFNEILPSQVAPGDFLLFGAHGDATHDGTGCWSYMGKKGGSQVINIPPPHCTSVELITHEILHATGALHEHNRPDRDNHIQILFDNIKPKMQQNFIKQQWEYDNAADGVESAGTGYDLYSILHYPSFAHGINSSAPTILSLNTNDTRFGSTGIMSITDEMELNLNYDCPIDLHLVVQYLHETVQTNSVDNEVTKEVNAQKVAITKITKKQEETDTKYDEIAKQISQLEILAHKSEGSQSQLEYFGSEEDGSSGPAGPPGPSGAPGPLGSPGLDGAPGTIGPPGPRGEMGLTGPQGEQITIDSQGLMAKLGELQFGGQQGRKGEPGKRGERGIPGKGSPGAAGKIGDNGQPGSTGQQGARGLPGSPGVKGDSGSPGKQCDEGRLMVMEKLMGNLLTRLENQEILIQELTSQLEMEKNETEIPEGLAIEDRVTHLEEVSKVNVLRTCAELEKRGIKTSGYYQLDPDGENIGHPPIEAFCNFETQGNALTIIGHNNDKDVLTIPHCDSNFCYKQEFVYNVHMDQIDALKQLSTFCEQTIKFSCYMTPLFYGNVQFGVWTDHYGEDQIYFDGANHGFQKCGCDSFNNCTGHELIHNTCNCDNTAVPEWMDDIGKIVNKTALPVMGFKYGPLKYQHQKASFSLGKLRCGGGKDLSGVPHTCQDLKLRGETRSGMYNLQDGDHKNHPKLAFCQLDKPGYEEIMETESHWLKLSSGPGTIYFSVRKTTSNDISNNAVVTFDETIANEGGGMDASNGIFTAPVAGVYDFKLSGLTYGGAGTTYINIYLNDATKVQMYDSNKSGSNSISMSFMLNMKKGDKVKLQLGSGGFHGGNNGLIFIGILL